MAKRKRVNKSEQVRNYLGDHPDAKPSVAAKALKKHGITPGFVSNIKSGLKTRSKKKRRMKKAARAGNSSTNHAAATHNAESIVAAARLMKLCGGPQEAKEALATAEKIANTLQ